MTAILKIALYVVAAFISVAALTTLAAIILFPRRLDEGADSWELEPMGEASSYRRDRS